ncbi:MAG: hypothetical protein QNL90_21840 [Gammaproteobacteria bacterium]|jgi:hypothetical protein|nr:hypothetical protein [Gammaproteobacteria bacterium]MDX2462801.1 hypothetical protein [Gammaproteobacteria bacterium]
MHMQQSTSDSTTRPGDNSDYQRRLAKSLVTSMDVHEAIHVCQENGWEGVLRFVIVLQHSDERCN